MTGVKEVAYRQCGSAHLSKLKAHGAKAIYEVMMTASFVNLNNVLQSNAPTHN